jgi:hypothetical protein|tara:strand:+ start:6479 stop:6940 length:462 start_codon:yes stop_codon:yes gene_type:complete
MKADNLTLCKRCGSDAAYKQEVNDEITNYSCFGCGFQSNSLMKKEGEFLNEQIEVLPELYKDLLFEDEDKQCWLPSTINLPTRGMVFANGSNRRNWKWAAVKAIEIKEDEKEKYPIPNKKDEYYKHRMDMGTMRTFEEKDYMEALSYIGILPE